MARTTRAKMSPANRVPAAIVRDHPPYGRWAHVHVGADGSPDPGDVRAEVARGRVLIVVQPPADQTRTP